MAPMNGPVGCPAFFTLDDLAARWRCARRSIIDMIARGELLALRINKRTYRVASDEVLRLERESKKP